MGSQCLWSIEVSCEVKQMKSRVLIPNHEFRGMLELPYTKSGVVLLKVGMLVVCPIEMDGPS